MQIVEMTDKGPDPAWAPPADPESVNSKQTCRSVDTDSLRESTQENKRKQTHPLPSGQMIPPSSQLLFRHKVGTVCTPHVCLISLCQEST